MNPWLMLCVATFGTASISGCGSKAKKPSQPTPTAARPAAPAPAAKSKPVAASPHLGVADDIAKRCNLRFSNTEQAPKFGYDNTELAAADRDILQQIADCLTRGPLQGRRVELIGHTDPRGTDEYNLGLGTRRADTVRTYLQRLGVPAARLSPTTRGEVDAAGVDESGWQRDRRVDLKLLD